MLELNKKCKQLKTIAFISIMLKVMAVIFSLFAKVKFSDGWIVVIDLVVYIAVFLIIAKKATQICLSNQYKWLLFPALYLIWQQSIGVYETVIYISFWGMEDVSGNLGRIVLACAPEICIIGLLIAAGYLVLFKRKKTLAPLVLLYVSAIIQVVDKVTPHIYNTLEEIGSTIFDLFMSLYLIINNIAILSTFFVLIFFVSTINANEPGQVETAILRKQKYNSAAKKGLGMKWYKYNIYFRLFLAIITLVADIGNVQMMYGDFWGISGKIDTYLWFTIVFDVGLIVGTILTRNWLAHFNEKGIKFYFITQYVSQIVLFMATLLLLGFSEDSFPQTLGRMIGYGVFFVLEYRYWKKRSFLFVTSGQSTYMYSDGSNSTQIKTPNNSFTICVYDTITKNIRKEERIVDTAKFPPEKFAVDGTYYAVEKMNSDKKVRVYCSKSSWQSQVDNQNIDKSKIKFCRKCGFKLLDNSEFCSQCGTKIV